MAWRINDAVTNGEIDNTVEGTTTGRIWLAGRDAPLVLSLAGDCWRDLAGARLRFANPKPITLPEAIALDSDQSGVIGDMTASRRIKYYTVDEAESMRLIETEQPVPFEWRNTLSLEWFSRHNGRIVIETSNFSLEIAPHAWQMDDDAEQAQKLANLHAMRDFMALVIRRRVPSKDEPIDKEMDEYEWEERLKESDRLSDAYQEVLEKYMDDPDSERKEAFVMGWDGLLDALAESEEDFGSPIDSIPFDEDEDEEMDEPDFASDDGGLWDGDIDDFDFGETDAHPLHNRAREIALRAMDLVEREAEPGTPAYRLVSNLLEVSGKLAGALNGRNSGFEPETGYVLAVLKRCLNWLNEAVGACQELMATEDDPDQLAALVHLRSSAFEIRDAITELRRELKS
jgi:hypothetical protein